VTKADAAGEGAGIATASVQPNTIYAATQEWGGIHTGRMWLWVRYIGPRAVRMHGWVRETVDIPGRPYMRTAVAETMASGVLTRRAADTFEAVVWGG
jgi:hypothetical protein